MTKQAALTLALLLARCVLCSASLAREKQETPFSSKVTKQVNIAYHLVSDSHTGLKVDITEAELDKDFARLKAIGFTHVTLWTGSILPRNSEEERLMKLAIRKAAEHGLGCYVWFWTAGKPLMYDHPFWKENSPPFVDNRGKPVPYMNLWDQRWRGSFLRDYLHWLGKTFSEYPNVAGYVIDEPAGSWWKWKQYGYDEQTRKQLIAWLKKKYGTLEAVNTAWGQSFQRWQAIKPPRAEPPVSEMLKPQSAMATRWRDWTAARRRFFIDWFADMKRYLKEAHPGCRIIWSITSRYVDNPPEHELADCLDWKRIMRHVDAILMAKFPHKDAEAVRFAREVMDGLADKPELKRVDKLYAIIVWRSSWVERILPQTLRQLLQLAAAKRFGIYVWAWQGPDHLEAWGDLQEVFRQFAAARAGK